MAFTNTKKSQYGIGNVVVQTWKVSADGTSGTLSTGLSSLLSWNHGVISAATTSRFNASAADGVLTITEIASGDDIYLTVVGN